MSITVHHSPYVLLIHCVLSQICWLLWTSFSSADIIPGTFDLLAWLSLATYASLKFSFIIYYFTRSLLVCTPGLALLSFKIKAYVDHNNRNGTLQHSKQDYHGEVNIEALDIDHACLDPIWLSTGELCVGSPHMTLNKRQPHHHGCHRSR